MSHETNTEEVSIREVVNIITEIMDFNGDVLFDTSKPDGQFRKPSDNIKLKKPNDIYYEIYKLVET